MVDTVINRIVQRENDVFYQNDYYFNRLRLHKLMEDAICYPLVVVNAGTGYGKTRAVHSFLQESVDINTTWIQMNKQSNEPAHFWKAYVDAVSLSWTEAGERLSKIGFPDTDEAFANYSAMVQESGKLTNKHIMVFDDFHLQQNPKILNFIEKTVRILPQNACVILISQTAPEFNVIRMMMTGSVFIINEDTLRFSETETLSYFNQLDIQVERRHIQEILEDTKGWAFAINLTARLLAKGAKYDRYMFESMKSNIISSIEADINATATSELQKFLLCVSLLEYPAASLIQTLAKDEKLIKEMEQLSAYIRMDFNMGMYILHPLFLEYLRKNQSKLTSEEKHETYKTAASWCHANHYEIEALTYYEKVKDYDAILQILYALKLQIPKDIAARAMEIFMRMPKSVKFESALTPGIHLKLHISLGLFDQASTLAKQYAKDYEMMEETEKKHRILAEIYGAWAVLRMLLCPYTNIYDFDSYFEKQRAYYDKSPFAALDWVTGHVASSEIILAGTACEGAPEKYIESVERAIPHVSHLIKQNIDGLADLEWGELFLLRRNIDDAEKKLKQALSKARMYNQCDIQCRALFHLMQIAVFRGDLDACNIALHATEAMLLEKHFSHRFVANDLMRSSFSLMIGKPERISDWLKSDFAPYAHPAFIENYANQVRAQYHYKTGQHNTLLAFIENDWERQAILFNKIELKILEALSFYQLKRRKEAFDSLTIAYNLAEPNKIVTPFIKHAKDMRTITAAARKSDTCLIPDEWLEDINRKASAFAKKQSKMISEYNVANNLTSKIALTKREMGILKDLSDGLSRSEIAVNQNISINTVKMVVNIIYEKLSANSLAEAIKIASERKII